MESIQKRLTAWAEETCQFYLPKAKELDMDFYTQSDLTLISGDQPVELIVVGINPGYGGHFQPRRFATSADLLRGNLLINEEGRPHARILEWRIMRVLRSILDYGNLGDLLADESRFVLTNATFFSTKRETGLNESRVREAQKASVEYTRKLIDAIRPRHIICLGGKNCTELLLGRKGTSPLLGGVVTLDYGQIGGIPAYGIDHTSACWSSEQMELVGKALERAFGIDSRPIDGREFLDKSQGIIAAFVKKRNDQDEVRQEARLRWHYIHASLRNYCKFYLGLEVAEEKRDWTRFAIADQEGKPVLLIAIVNQSDKYLGVRYLEKNHAKDESYETIFSWLSQTDKSFAPVLDDQGQVVWIGKMSLSKRLRDTDTFIRDTKELLRKIAEGLSVIAQTGICH